MSDERAGFRSLLIQVSLAIIPRLVKRNNMGKKARQTGSLYRLFWKRRTAF